LSYRNGDVNAIRGPEDLALLDGEEGEIDQHHVSARDIHRVRGSRTVAVAPDPRCANTPDSADREERAPRQDSQERRFHCQNYLIEQEIKEFERIVTMYLESDFEKEIKRIEKTKAQEDGE
jgi:hypothetical protein